MSDPRLKDAVVNIRMGSGLRRKLSFLAATENRNLSAFARLALEKATAAALREIAEKTEPEGDAHE